MEVYIQEALKQEYVIPSTSPASARFFFVEEKIEAWDCASIFEIYTTTNISTALEQLKQQKSSADWTWEVPINW